MYNQDSNDNISRPIAKLEQIIKGDSKNEMHKREIQLDQEKAFNHQKLYFDGIEIHFPYKPYKIQEDYIRNVVQALNTKSNALLQSPTGTGKTLSLLCAALGWLRYQRKNGSSENKTANRILFCSRTHSQLKQVMRELKFTAYKPKVCIMASRDQYCLKKDFSILKDLELNGACKDAVKKKTCQYYNYSGDSGKQQPKILEEVLDIEDLQEKARCKNFCPYYYSREIKDEADVIILPYNFLLQQNRFAEFQVILQDSIIIFDEAHNVPSAAEEGTSYKVDQNLIQESQNELEYLENNLTPQMRTDKDDIKDARQLVTAIGNLIKYFEVQGKVEKLKDGSTGMVCPVSTLFEMIEQIGGQLLKNNNQKSKKKIKYEQYKQKVQQPNGSYKQFFNYKDMLSDMKQARDDQKKKEAQQQPTLFNFNFKKTSQTQHRQEVTFQQKNQQKQEYKNSEKKEFEYEESAFDKQSQKNMIISMKKILLVSKKLSKIITDMQTMKCQNIDFFAGFIVGICDMYEQDQQFIKGQSKKKLSDYYKFYFNKATTNYEQSSINLWCLDPSLAFENILSERPHSILLTSGTLHPLNAWDLELRVDFNVKLTSSHVINIQKSVVGGFVKNGPNGQQLNFSYNNRSNGIQVYEELGEFLIGLCRSVPNGILVCFSSTSLMKLAQDSWSQSQLNILNRIGELKDYYFEPKNNSELQYTMKQYCAGSERDSKGAILFCVCRGKISEGIDFTDKLARAVVIVGVPFPPSLDTWVCTKKEYLDNQTTRENNDQNLKTLSGKEWYFLNTVRALNQAIGRVIRHKDDYGSVYLCDTRYSSSQFDDQISGWVRPVLKKYQQYDELIQDANNFFAGKNQAITSLDEILKIGSEKKENKISIKDVAQKELNYGKLSQIHEQSTILQVKESKRKVIGNSSNDNYQPIQVSSKNFTNNFLQNQQNLMKSDYNNNTNTKKTSQNKNIIQIYKEDEFDNNQNSIQRNIDFNDQKQLTNTESEDSDYNEEELAYFKKLVKKVQQKDEMKNKNNKMIDENDNKTQQQSDFSQIKFSNNNQMNIKFQEEFSQVSTFKKQNGDDEQFRQKRKITINEQQGSTQVQKSPMNVNKYSHENNNVSQEIESQNPVLKLKSMQASKEYSVAFKDKSLSQQSLVNFNKPLFKNSKDDMMNLFRGSSDDDQSNSFDIIHKKDISKQSITNENSLSANFLNDVFRKHSTQNTNNSISNKDQQIIENGFLNVSNIKYSSLPDNLQQQESTQNNRSKSMKVIPLSKEEGNDQQKTFKHILNTRNSQNSQLNINQLSNIHNKEQPEHDYSEEKQKPSNPFSQRGSFNKMNQINKVLLTNNQRGLASFKDGDIFTKNASSTNQNQSQLIQQQQSLQEQSAIQQTNQKPQDHEQKNAENVCPICYEIPKNKHRSNICQHSACYECFKNWLEEQLTCPMCRVRCRVVYLEPCL